jgi:hypothetical protein
MIWRICIVRAGDRDGCSWGTSTNGYTPRRGSHEEIGGRCASVPSLPFQEAGSIAVVRFFTKAVWRHRNDHKRQYPKTEAGSF